MKHCPGCDTDKPESAYSACTRLPSGLDAYCRPCKAGYTRSWSQRLRAAVLAAYGGSPPRCACCATFYEPHLTIDHIAGRKVWGHTHERSGRIFYTWLAKQNYPDGFQVLCWNCNSAKYRLGKCGCQDG